MACQEIKWVGRNFVEQSLGHSSLSPSGVPVYFPASVLHSGPEIFAIRTFSSLYLLLFSHQFHSLHFEQQIPECFCMDLVSTEC